MGKDNDEAAGGFGSVFRDRLTYLMNGNNVYGKPVNTQELADEIAISRPAVRKYLKPNDRREVTVPSALVVSRIARYFRTTPNFLLGFDEAADDADAQRAGESAPVPLRLSSLSFLQWLAVWMVSQFVFLFSMDHSVI